MYFFFSLCVLKCPLSVHESSEASPLVGPQWSPKQRHDTQLENVQTTRKRKLLIVSSYILSDELSVNLK